MTALLMKEVITMVAFESNIRRSNALNKLGHDYQSLLFLITRISYFNRWYTHLTMVLAHTPHGRATHHKAIHCGNHSRIENVLRV